jgi:hypothetical protein
MLSALDRLDFLLAFKLLNYVSGVDPAGGELRSVPRQHVQEPHATLVDEGDLVEVHDAGTPLACLVVLLPACP